MRIDEIARRARRAAIREFASESCIDLTPADFDELFNEAYAAALEAYACKEVKNIEAFAMWMAKTSCIKMLRDYYYSLSIPSDLPESDDIEDAFSLSPEQLDYAVRVIENVLMAGKEKRGQRGATAVHNAAVILVMTACGGLIKRSPRLSA